MRQQVPAAGAVAVVVEPGAEDEVRGRGEEETTWLALVFRIRQKIESCFSLRKVKEGRT